jgi:hypothetical protein
MGLDISVYRLTKEKQDRYFSLVDDDGNYQNDFPEWTKSFEQEVTERWYDWNKFKEETGIDIKNCTWLSEEYGEEGDFMEVWPNEFGKVPQVEDFKIGEDKYDWEAYDAAKGEHIVKINLEKVPLYDKVLKVIYIEEVGYQRKGLNNQFYRDYRDGKIGYYVWSNKELQRYKKDYCDRPYEYVYANGEKSGQIIHPKIDFQRNIIDNFKEGECVVTFSW